MRKHGPTFAAVAFIVATMPVPAAGQLDAGPMAAVKQIFQGMRTADADMVREVFAPDARFATLDNREGTAQVTVQGVGGWIGAIGESGGQWNEQIYDVIVNVDRDMASIWAPYTFYLDGNLRHCGINSIELLRDTDGWKVTQLSDTRQTEGCPDPLGG